MTKTERSKVTNTSAENLVKQPSSWSMLGVGVLFLALLWYVALPPTYQLGFPLDDAWIHMVYGRSLATEGLLGYNPGILATGSTSPLWAGLVGLVHLCFSAISLNAVIAGVMFLGCSFFLGCIAVGSHIVWRLTQEKWLALLAGFLLATNSSLAGAAFSGMEVTLCAFLSLLSTYLFLQRKWQLTGWTLALAALTRPESALLSILFFAALLFSRMFKSHAERAKGLVFLSYPSALLGGLLVVFNLYATGRPLPATFYIKQTASFLELPERLWITVTQIYNQSPPFVGYIAWLALAGYIVYLVWKRKARSKPEGAYDLSFAFYWLPLVAGLTLLMANVFVVRPSDPQAFYHQRYVQPAIPLLILGLILGVHLLGNYASQPLRWAPHILLGLAGLWSTSLTVSATSYKLHNDTRNINEVQRKLGDWLKQHTKPDAWIATSDAGAIRYFSERSALDLIGLNTPEVLWQSPTFTRKHPVVAIAIMPAFFLPRNTQQMEGIHGAITKSFTVTSNPRMAQQVILSCRGPSQTSVRLYFQPIYKRTNKLVEVTCLPRQILK